MDIQNTPTDIELELRRWTDGMKFVLATKDAPEEVLNRSTFIASSNLLLKWVSEFPGNIGTIYIADTEVVFVKAKYLRPKLDIRRIVY